MRTETTATSKPVMTIVRSNPANGKPSQSYVMFGNTSTDSGNWSWFERAGFASFEKAEAYAAKKGWTIIRAERRNGLMFNIATGERV